MRRNGTIFKLSLVGLETDDFCENCALLAATSISNKFTNKQILFTVLLLSFVCKFTLLFETKKVNKRRAMSSEHFVQR